MLTTQKNARNMLLSEVRNQILVFQIPMIQECSLLKNRFYMIVVQSLVMATRSLHDWSKF